jgi:flagellar protein FlaG
MMNNINAAGLSNISNPEAKIQTSVQQNKTPTETKKEIRKEETSSSEGVAAPEDLERTVTELNKKLANEELRVAFSMDQDSGNFVVKIHDSQTGELVRQIPSKETLKFAQNVEKGIGIIVDSEY